LVLRRFAPREPNVRPAEPPRYPAKTRRYHGEPAGQLGIRFKITMRLIEEQKNIRIQMILAISILFSTVFVQFADSQITKHHNKIITDLSTVIHAGIVAASYGRAASFYELHQRIPELNVEIDSDYFSSPQSDHFDPEEKQMVAKLQNKEIDDKEFLKQSLNHKKKKYRDLLHKFNQDSLNLGEMMAKGTIWTLIRNVLVIIQFALILTIIYMYCNLLLSISKRTTKNKT
jgi:hypothetical protein